MCFENLAKLLSVAYLFPFCLCAPGSFCFIAFDDGLKTERRGRRERKAYFRSLCAVSSWEVTMAYEQRYEQSCSMIPI